ncbi:hypothetical protein Lesp02_46260 [Lentzea sp. NBRC 105346]|uniref:hypothetical protein n=1 Tax=Lentzea sp. NBRC 105346 TaxID=3032205 RepID=UPI0024A48A7B|nr:hypothetical protein [Lentzea sp. NBRC 105346]GLZ32438.1 hypothetical protein Lesp02_46260 [Lentzea sp. NBRC 105346]
MTKPALRLQPTIHDKLADLGLRLTHLDQAIWAGIDARAASPPHGPTNGPGLLDWIHRVGKLRSLLVAEGWKRLDQWNAGLVRHPTLPIVLGTLQGNRNTGVADAPLRSDYAKGPAIAAMMRDNDHDQFSLFETMAHKEGLKLWFLVTYPLQLEDRLVVLREVSQPEPTPQGQVIERWAHRITLPPLEFPHVHARNANGPDDVDFPIALKNR